MITCDMITQTASAFYKLPVREIYSLRRAPPLVRARQMGWYLARHMTDRSYPQIARAMGNRDAATVQHGVHMLERRITLNPQIGEEARAIGAMLIRLEISTPAPEPLSREWGAAELLRASYIALSKVAADAAAASAELDTAYGSPREKAAQSRLKRSLTTLRNHLAMENKHV